MGLNDPFVGSGNLKNCFWKTILQTLTHMCNKKTQKLMEFCIYIYAAIPSLFGYFLGSKNRLASPFEKKVFWLFGTINFEGKILDKF